MNILFENNEELRVGAGYKIYQYYFNSVMSPPATMATVTQPANSPSASSSTSRGTASNLTANTIITNGDSLFEPSVEMMVNDFDDERTLEEEEALAATEADDPSAELSSLQRVYFCFLYIYNTSPLHITLRITNVSSKSNFV